MSFIFHCCNIYLHHFFVCFFFSFLLPNALFEIDSFVILFCKYLILYNSMELKHYELCPKSFEQKIIFSHTFTSFWPNIVMSMEFNVKLMSFYWKLTNIHEKLTNIHEKLTNFHERMTNFLVNFNWKSRSFCENLTSFDKQWNWISKYEK